MFYLYIDRRNDNNSIIYVGIGTKSRVKNMHRNRYHVAIKNKIGINREIILSSADYGWILIQEILAIKYYNTYNGCNSNGCNFTKGGEGTLGLNPYTRMSEETKKQLRIIKSNNAKLQNNPCSKTNMSKELRLKKAKLATITRKERKIPAWNKNKKCPQLANSNNGFFNKSHTDECKTQMSEIRRRYLKENLHPNLRKVINTDTGDIFDSIKDAASKFGIFPSSISHVCKGKFKTAGGYKWEYYV